MSGTASISSVTIHLNANPQRLPMSAFPLAGAAASGVIQERHVNVGLIPQTIKLLHVSAADGRVASVSAVRGAIVFHAPARPNRHSARTTTPPPTPIATWNPRMAAGTYVEAKFEVSDAFTGVAYGSATLDVEVEGT